MAAITHNLRTDGELTIGCVLNNTSNKPMTCVILYNSNLDGMSAKTIINSLSLRRLPIDEHHPCLISKLQTVPSRPLHSSGWFIYHKTPLIMGKQGYLFSGKAYASGTFPNYYTHLGNGLYEYYSVVGDKWTYEGGFSVTQARSTEYIQYSWEKGSWQEYEQGYPGSFNYKKWKSHPIYLSLKWERVENLQFPLGWYYFFVPHRFRDEEIEGPRIFIEGRWVGSPSSATENSVWPGVWNIGTVRKKADRSGDYFEWTQSPHEEGDSPTSLEIEELVKKLAISLNLKAPPGTNLLFGTSTYVPAQIVLNGSQAPSTPDQVTDSDKEKDSNRVACSVRSWVTPDIDPISNLRTYPGNAPGLTNAEKDSTLEVSVESDIYNIVGWRFLRWFRDGKGSTDNPVVITVDGDKNVPALFVRKTYLINVSTGEGQGTTYPQINPNDRFYYKATAFTTAYPAPGYEFDRWEIKGDATQSDTSSPTYSTTVDGDQEWVAHFRPLKYTVSFKANGDGLGSVFFEVDGQTTEILNSDLRSLNFKQPQFDFGSNIRFWAVAKDGSDFVCWNYVAGDRLNTHQEQRDIKQNLMFVVTFSKKPSAEPKPNFSFQLFCPVPTTDSEVIELSEFKPPKVPETRCE